MKTGRFGFPPSCLGVFLTTILVVSLVLPGFLTASAASNPDYATREEATRFYQHLSPLPGAQYLHRENNIIIRQGDPIDKSSFHNESILVQGSASGLHPGSLHLTSDDKTLVFAPYQPFTPSETVEVAIRNGIHTIDGLRLEPITYTFSVSHNREQISFDSRSGEHLVELLPQEPVEMERAAGGLNELDEYDLPPDFPEVTIVSSNNPDPGLLLICRKGLANDGRMYLMGLTNEGEVEFYLTQEDGADCFDIQPSGDLSWFHPPSSSFHVMDTTYTIRDTWQCGNGYTADLHEFRHLPNGHSFLMAYDPQVVDMSEIVPGGQENAIVIGLVLQELDPEHEVIFQWRSWDHFEITDAADWLSLLGGNIDYVHGNAIEVETDGSLLLSSRHLEEITKIDGETGEIIWRLGGDNNQFTFMQDPYQFSCQHDIRRLPNGNITLFDNGNYHNPHTTRALEYELDEDNMVAELVWSYTDPTGLLSSAMGSMQRLPNGNTLIGWGMRDDPNGTPEWVEINSQGDVAFQVAFQNTEFPYRSRRAAWQGEAVIPNIVASSTNDGDIHLAFGLFGREDVENYHIFQGTAPGTIPMLDSTTVTSMVVSQEDYNPGDTLLFGVRARLTDGSLTEMSEIEAYILPVQFTLIQPLNRAVLETSFAVLRWYRDPLVPHFVNPTHYVDFSTDSLFNTYQTITTQDTFYVLSEIEDVLGASSGLDELPDNTTLYWRVHRVNWQGTVFWAIPGPQGWSFTISIPEPPSPFELLAPPNRSVLNRLETTLHWSASVDPDPGDSITYSIKLSTDSTFTDDELVQLLHTERSEQTISELNDDTTYWWTVHASDTNTDGTAASDTFSFSIAIPQLPELFELIAPLNQDTLTLGKGDSLEFVWFSSWDPDPDQRPTYNLDVVASIEETEYRYWIDGLQDTALVVLLLDSLDAIPSEDPWSARWRVWAISEGDTVQCRNEFLFVVEPVSAAAERAQELPVVFSVGECYPNPFNSTAMVQIGLPRGSRLEVRVLNVLGREVSRLAQGRFPGGYHTLHFNAAMLPSGVYFVQVSVPAELNEIRKITLVK